MRKLAYEERTEGTETSKYLEEYKSKEIPLVAASERGEGQTYELAHRGCRTCIRKNHYKRSVWEVTPKRVKVSYRK